MNEKLKEHPLTLVVVLGLVCLLAGAALSLVYLGTKSGIKAREAEAKRDALLRVHPDASPEGFELVETETPGNGEPYAYYEVYNKPLDDQMKQLIGYACEGRAQGYSSTIVVTVGLKPDANTITGISITNQQETPGLGANCEKVRSSKYIWHIVMPSDAETETQPWFQKQFNGLAADSFVREGKTYKGIDAISGATITTNAVVRAVLDAVSTFHETTGIGDVDDVDAATSATATGWTGESEHESE
jgi:electron transport complex protein RnfG